MSINKTSVLAPIAVGLLIVGGTGLQNPPGLFGFAATSCSGVGDCANYMAPIFLSVLSAVVGALLLLYLVSTLAIRRWRASHA